MIRVSICEDVPEELQKLKNMVEDVMIHLYRNIKLYGFRSGEDLLIEIEETGDMDIVFLDIEMAGMSGIETAKAIRERNNRTVLVFVSAYDQYCKELIEVQPFAFLDKPVSNAGLKTVLERAVEMRFGMGEEFNFSYGKKQYRILLARIRYFQSDKRKILVEAMQGNQTSVRYSFYGKMEEVEKEIGGSSIRFLRVRKSFLVNTGFIEEYAADRIVLDNGVEIMVSRSYREAVRRHHISVLGEKAWGLY